MLYILVLLIRIPLELCGTEVGEFGWQEKEVLADKGETLPLTKTFPTLGFKGSQRIRNFGRDTSVIAWRNSDLDGWFFGGFIVAGG